MSKKTTYVIETRRVCRCSKEVDAVREVGDSHLRYSRHLKKTGRGFCAVSLDEVAPR